MVGALLAACAVLFVAGLWVGDVMIGPSRALSALVGVPESRSDDLLVSSFRLPRVVLGFVIGAMLAVAGTITQQVVRNPLVEPGLLGVIGGASLAVVSTVVLFDVSDTVTILPVVAVAGALGAGALVYAAAYQHGRTNPLTLVLAGLVVSAMLSAAIGFVLYTNRDIAELAHFLVGSLENRRWDHVRTVLPWFTLVVPFVVVACPYLNLLQLGDETATSGGIRPERTRAALILLAVLLAGAAVAVGGAIAFLGLVAPHLARMLVGNDARHLVPVSALIGSVILVAADTLARTIELEWFGIPVAGNTAPLPAGVFTVLLGVPIFLRLIVRWRPGRLSW